jgi:hypothetical protein
MRRILLALVLLLALAPSALAQARPHTPARGTPERQALMDALRGRMRQELGKPMIFEVNELRVVGDWAFAMVIPRKPDGAPFDYSGTPMEEGWREGFVDDASVALLRRERGAWRVVELAIGPTDVAWIGWDEAHGAPRAVFPYPDQ